MFIDIDKGGAGDDPRDLHPRANALGQTSLAAAEVALKTDDIARLEQTAQPLADAMRLLWAVCDDVERPVGQNR